IERQIRDLGILSSLLDGIGRSSNAVRFWIQFCASTASSGDGARGVELSQRVSKRLDGRRTGGSFRTAGIYDIDVAKGSPIHASSSKRYEGVDCIYCGRRYFGGIFRHPYFLAASRLNYWCTRCGKGPIPH